MDDLQEENNGPWTREVGKKFDNEAMYLKHGIEGDSVVPIIPSQPEQKKYVAGYVVADESKAQAKGLALKHLARQVEEKAAVKDKMKEYGLSYEAILPTSFFKKLIGSFSSLFTFKNPDANNMVYVDTKYFSEHGVASAVEYGVCAACLVLASVASVIWMMTAGSLTAFHCIPLIRLIMGVVMGVIIFAMPRPKPGGRLQRTLYALSLILLVPEATLILLLRNGPYKFFIKMFGILAPGMLWPNRSDEGLAVSGNPGTVQDSAGPLAAAVTLYNPPPRQVKIVLPDPPKNILEILQKCFNKGLKPYTIVYEDSFGIESSGREKEIITEPSSLICLDEGAYTVILGQVGGASERNNALALTNDYFETLKKNFVVEPDTSEIVM